MRISRNAVLSTLCFCVAAVFIALPSSAHAQAKPHSRVLSWPAFVSSFIDTYFSHRPDLAVMAGRHEFDGRLPNWSKEGIALHVHFLKEQRAAAEKFGSLNRAQEFERQYLIAHIDSDLFQLEVAELPFTNPTYYTSFQGLDPNVYVTREYAPLEKRMAAFVAYLKNVPTAVEQIRGNLRTPMPRTFINVGRTGFGGLAKFFEKDVPAVFASVQDPKLQEEFLTANKAAVESLKALDTWLELELQHATDNFAMGADKFRELLRATEMVDISLDELTRIGQRDLDRNLAALTNACSKLAPGRSIQDCIRIVQTNKPAEGPVQAARDQLGGLKEFLVDQKLVTIPSPEVAKVEESLPYMRWNSAYINIPGPYEKGLPAIYYIAPPDPAWTPEEQQEYISSYSELLFTSIHEVWPGHFLQFLHSNRSQSRFGQVFVGYAFAEGWAHYTEELMWEAGLQNDNPAVQTGMLLNALLRNVRFMSTIGLHTGKMTVADSEKMFREVAFQDAANARQQAARGTFDPAYLNYTMGKLMIRKLRDDWCKDRGGREAWRAFHDEFLSYGGPPIPLIRKAMLRDTKNLF
ncbi:MAG TPA: DUF885 domain-containing protein [Verrucomicrobiae bacterium]